MFFGGFPAVRENRCTTNMSNWRLKKGGNKSTFDNEMMGSVDINEAVESPKRPLWCDAKDSSKDAKPGWRAIPDAKWAREKKNVEPSDGKVTFLRNRLPFGFTFRLIDEGESKSGRNPLKCIVGNWGLCRVRNKRNSESD